jgi:ABC-type Fe3+-hydroxamate transport system substrate-binding protein
VLKNIPRLSRLPSAEQIAGLKPDIVIMDADWAKMNKDLLKDLDKAKIKYAALNRPKWAVLGQYLDKLGALSGRSKEAAQTLLLSEKSLSKSDIRSGKTEKMRVFVVAGADYSTCAPDSWGARLIDATGARILTDSKGTRVQDFSWYIFYGPQKLADNAKNVDVIITLKNIGRGVPSVSRESIVNDPMFKNTPAVKNGRVWEMDESDLMLPSLVRLDSSLLKCWQLISYKTK